MGVSFGLRVEALGLRIRDLRFTHTHTTERGREKQRDRDRETETERQRERERERDGRVAATSLQQRQASSRFLLASSETSLKT